MGAPTRSRAAPILLVVGWALLTVAWIFGNPPFAAPDEGANYLRALEVGRGHLITTREPDAARGATERQTRFLRNVTYSVQVPPGHGPLPADCYVLHRDQSAACLDSYRPPPTTTRTTTYVGNYEPLPYLLVGAPVRAVGTPAAGLRVGRLINATIVLALLAVAVALLWDGSAGIVSCAGLLLAVTPMALFCAASLTGSGLEIGAGTALAAAILRLSRHAETGAPAPPRWVWWAAAVAGATLAFTRPLGPLWVVLLAAFGAALIGPRQFVDLARTRKRTAAAAAGAVLIGIVANRLWEAAYGGGTTISFESLRRVLWAAVEEWWRASSELIGKFGYLEYRITWLYIAWFGIAFAVIAIAARAATRRQRAVLALACAFAAIFPMVMWIGGVRITGFGMQGRYVLPVLVAVPMLAGELVYRHAGTGSRVIRAVPVAVALMQFGAWYVAARRSAVGLDGPQLFVSNAEWSPPGGWLIWLVIAGVGAASVAASAAGKVAARGPSAT